MDDHRQWPWIPLACALAYVAVFGQVFSSVRWPYVDLYYTLSEAARWDWLQYVQYTFGRDVEYRPLFTLAIKLAYEVVGLQLWFYVALVIAQFGAVLALLVWLFRPVGLGPGLAACVAVGCVVGLHTTRVLFMFVPLNGHSAGLILVLFAIALAIDPRTRPVDWVFLPLTLGALLMLESGLLIAPLVIALWWVNAPGVGRRGVAAMLGGVAAYLAIRLTFSAVGAPPAIYTDSGLGFAERSVDDLRAIFEHAPWLFWAYNVVATFLSVAVSEPRAGIYRFVEGVLRGDAPAWSWFHVASSLVTSGAIVGALTFRPPASSRDRVLVVSGLVLITFGSALGFLYTRDRIALTASVGYVFLLYVALVRWLAWRPATGWQRRVVVGGVCVVAAVWLVRGAERYFQIRDLAWDYHLEWTTRYQDLHGDQPDTELLATLRSAALAVTPADPSGDPAWSYALFERQFTPGGGRRASPDQAADAVRRPPSAPFDLRWAPEVDDASRARFEQQLGLIEGERVERDPRERTWSYRLDQPSREGVRAILAHPAVEDTARINRTRFEIEE